MEFLALQGFFCLAAVASTGIIQHSMGEVGVAVHVYKQPSGGKTVNKPRISAWILPVGILALLLTGCAAQPAAAPQPAAPSAVVETPTPQPTAVVETPTPQHTAVATQQPTATEPPKRLGEDGPDGSAEPSLELSQTVTFTATLKLDNGFFTNYPPPLVLRRGPADHFQVTGQVQPDQAVTLLGRNETGSKVLVRLADGPDGAVGAEGWTWGHVLTADKNEISQLPVVEPPAELYDEEKIARIEISGALDPDGRYAAYLTDVIRQIQAADKDGSAPIPNTAAELMNDPGYAQWAAVFEASIGYPAASLVEQLQIEDWLYPTYGPEYTGALRIVVYISEDERGLIGWDWEGYLPDYVPVIEIPRHYLDRALAGDRYMQDVIKTGLLKEMIAAQVGRIAGQADPNVRYNETEAIERSSLFAEAVFMRRMGYPPELVKFYYDRAGVGYVDQDIRTGEIEP